MPYYADDPMCLLGVEMNVPDNVWIGAQELAALRARVAELEKVAEAAKADRSAFVPANTWLVLEDGTVNRLQYKVYRDGRLQSLVLPVVSAEWLQALDSALAALEGGSDADS